MLYLHGFVDYFFQAHVGAAVAAHGEDFYALDLRGHGRSLLPWQAPNYVTELATSGEQDYFRPNFFVNTPDILTEELQTGGPAKFASRLVLAATLSPSYGIYSGFESYEHEPVAPGSVRTARRCASRSPSA